MLGRGCRGKALEVVGQTNVGEELVAVRMEMQERSRVAHEVAARALTEAGDASQLLQQRLELIEVRVVHVAHGAIFALCATTVTDEAVA